MLLPRDGQALHAGQAALLDQPHGHGAAAARARLVSHVAVGHHAASVRVATLPDGADSPLADRPHSSRHSLVDVFSSTVDLGEMVAAGVGDPQHVWPGGQHVGPLSGPGQAAMDVNRLAGVPGRRRLTRSSLAHACTHPVYGAVRNDLAPCCIWTVPTRRAGRDVRQLVHRTRPVALRRRNPMPVESFRVADEFLV